MAWHLSGAKPFSEPMMAYFYWCMYVSLRPQWLRSYLSSQETIRQITFSTLQIIHFISRQASNLFCLYPMPHFSFVMWYHLNCFKNIVWQHLWDFFSDVYESLVIHSIVHSVVWRLMVGGVVFDWQGGAGLKWPLYSGHQTRQGGIVVLYQTESFDNGCTQKEKCYPHWITRIWFDFQSYSNKWVWNWVSKSKFPWDRFVLLVVIDSANGLLRLPNPNLIYTQLDFWEPASMKFDLKTKQNKKKQSLCNKIHCWLSAAILFQPQCVILQTPSADAHHHLWDMGGPCRNTCFLDVSKCFLRMSGKPGKFSAPSNMLGDRLFHSLHVQP